MITDDMLRGFTKKAETIYSPSELSQLKSELDPRVHSIIDNTIDYASRYGVTFTSRKDVCAVIGKSSAGLIWAERSGTFPKAIPIQPGRVAHSDLRVAAMNAMIMNASLVQQEVA
ncbi:hypothetical protein [Ruegeria arenilitoris]|uniref:hypothetical protein n=1 Tax=Ruegeria arenilitoris TaxID=1173585 RepID=UPI00147FB16E|nr:hypothetical protein [Ruegeria arenilitoris]